MTLHTPYSKSFMRFSLLFILYFFSAYFSHAQELNCVVSINANQIQTSDRGIFREMKTSIEQFMNGRKWTNDTFKPHEKISCSMLITIMRMPSIGNFVASVQIQSARPVYNSNYSSLMFNFADREWECEYVESQPLEFNDNNYTSNLTSMLAFYAYMIAAIDYDSFSELGGTTYYQKAQQVVINAQQAGRSGWSQTGNRNRYQLIDGYINSQSTDLRKSYYHYHRLGLDQYEKDPDNARTTILKGLKDIKKIRDINPSSILVISFFDAKSKEIANIFSSGNIQTRREAYDLVTLMDPTNRSTYAKMIEN
jgi:hypothetical protein